MTIQKAMEIVLGLAELGALDRSEYLNSDEDMVKMAEEQAEAIETVQSYDFQFPEEE